MSTILIVDDELAIAESLAMILEDEGHLVICASNGRHGLERMALTMPDLILLDFVMPVMNGAEMGRAVRERYTERRVPIVVNSSLTEAAVRALFADYDAFLRKPYRVAALLQVIDALLSGGGAKPSLP